MHVKTTTGAEVDIPHEEAMRIAKMMHSQEHEKWNSEYHKRAHENLEKALGTSIADNEEAVKQAMYHHMEWWSQKDVEVVFEMAEWIASCHYAHMTDKD